MNSFFFLSYFPSTSRIAFSASDRCLKLIKAKQGGFVATHTSLIGPYFVNTFSISLRETPAAKSDT
jgi:hypothetical protein